MHQSFTDALVKCFDNFPMFAYSFIGRPFVQEGQHPLTGQRAANFRLLANQ